MIESLRGKTVASKPVVQSVRIIRHLGICDRCIRSLYVRGPSFCLLDPSSLPPHVSNADEIVTNHSASLYRKSGSSRGGFDSSRIRALHPTMIGLGAKSKYNKTDQNAHLQYPHQTAGGRREIRAASDQSNPSRIPSLQKSPSQDRVGIANGNTELTLHHSQLVSSSASPHQPAIQDSQDRHQQSQTSSSRPLSPANKSPTPYHASSTSQMKPSFGGMDAEAGKNPKTWTRNGIRIPLGTR
jgi:hypothetical protein